jgi:plasmid maintenance system killer protein
MTCRINLIVVTKVVDLHTSCIHSHNHEEKVDKISSNAHYQRGPDKNYKHSIKINGFSGHYTI